MAGAGYKAFADGDVLTAAQVQTYLQDQAVMRFADSSARTTGLGTAVAEGMVSYLADTNTLEVYDGSGWTGVTKVKKVEAFTSSGTWTVPAGVEFAVAHMVGGGGGGGGLTSSTGVRGSDGGTSSVAFDSGTETALAGRGGPGAASAAYTTNGLNGPANSGRGGGVSFTSVTSRGFSGGENAPPISVGGTVTPGGSVTVTVGSGGAGGGATATGGTGGSGYVLIEYYE